MRDGRGVVGRCIESVLSQSLGDLELIVSDNASDDDTVETVMGYAQADRRVRLSVNPADIGSHENMNRVLAEAHGRYFRWISADDWLEPGCLSACVGALECQPEAIGVTTWFTIHAADGLTRYEEYRGNFRLRRIRPGGSSACCGSSTPGTPSTTRSTLSTAVAG